LKRIYIEREKCLGCLTCVYICMNVHRKDRGDLDTLPFFTDIESRGYISYSDGYSTPIYCRHCDDPECVATCMSGALQKKPGNKTR
jgi:carbon-monoxide dehydrogenase iron sulfur subunit